MMQRKGAGRGLRPRPAALLCSHRQRPAAPAPALHSTERGPQRSLRAAGPPPASPRRLAGFPSEVIQNAIFCIIRGSRRPVFQCSRRQSRIYKPLVGYKIFVLYRVSVKCPGKTAGAGRGFCFAIGSRFSLSHAALRAENHRVVYRRHRGDGRTKGRAAPRCARRGVRPVVGGSQPRSCKAPISPGYTSRQPRGPWKGGSRRQHGKGRALLGSHSAGVAPPLHPAGAVSPVSSAHGQRNRGTTPPGLRSGSRPASRSVKRWAGPIYDSIVFSKFYLTNRCQCGIIRLHRR